MLQIHTISFTNGYTPCDLKGTIMPAADKAERLSSVCLITGGSSGCLAPGDFVRAPE